jgi:hypothetical protein
LLADAALSCPTCAPPPKKAEAEAAPPRHGSRRSALAIAALAVIAASWASLLAVAVSLDTERRALAASAALLVGTALSLVLAVLAWTRLRRDPELAGRWWCAPATGAGALTALAYLAAPPPYIVLVMQQARFDDAAKRVIKAESIYRRVYPERGYSDSLDALLAPEIGKAPSAERAALLPSTADVLAPVIGHTLEYEPRKDGAVNDGFRLRIVRSNGTVAKEWTHVDGEKPSPRAQARHRAWAAALRLPDEREARLFRERCPECRSIVDIALDRAVWADAFALFDARTGLGKDHTIVVSFKDEGSSDEIEVATGGGTPDQGRVTFLMNRLIRHMQEKQYGTRRDYVCVMAHELTHVFQFEPWPPAFTMAPKWLREGMAEYGGDCLDNMMSFADLERDPEGAQAYGAGLLFFIHFEERFGRAKTMEFIDKVVRRHVPYQKAFEEIAGGPWERARREHSAWVLRRMASMVWRRDHISEML